MSSESSTTMQPLATAAAGDEQRSINEFLARITTGDPKPLGGDDVPWFEQGVITEIDPQIWRSFFVDSDATTITDDQGISYFLVGGDTPTPRLFWNRGDLYLARELSVSEATSLALDETPTEGDDDGETLRRNRLAQLEQEHQAHIVGWIPNDVDCSRMRLAVKCGIAADFQKDPDHVEFFESAQDTAKGRQVPVFLAYASQTPPKTRESMFQWVRGCTYGRSAR